MLHMEVFMQRLDQEHGIAVVTTTPTVSQPHRAPQVIESILQILTEHHKPVDTIVIESILQ
jgi:translation elongation factor EF-4